MHETALGGSEVGPRLVVALDYADMHSALDMAAKLNPESCRVKVGKELFTREGPEVVRQLVARGFEVFLDLKFHDIPTTTAKACLAAADLGAWMINVHVSGGQRMMEAAKSALESAGHQCLLIGVTVLTSMEAVDLPAVGLQCTPEEQVLRLAGLARESGLDGVVCSAHEAPGIKRLDVLLKPFVLVTPGIRLANSLKDDQRRIMTPDMAVKAGADYVVVGRPITRAKDPSSVVSEINRLLG